MVRFRLDEAVEFDARYNISPGTDIPVVRQSPDGKRVLHLLRWGLVPHWAKEPGIGTNLINARGESLADRPSFGDAFRRRRSLVPASGYYEWATEGKVKQPYYISLKSGELMAMAGLWEFWKTPDGSILHTVCIVTTTAPPFMEVIHNRMPAIIEPDNWREWLAGPAEKVEWMVAAYADAPLQAWPVGERVSNTGDDDEDLIAEVPFGG